MTDDADYLVLFLLVILVMGDRWKRVCVCARRDHKYTDMNDTSCFDG